MDCIHERIYYTPVYRLYYRVKLKGKKSRVFKTMDLAMEYVNREKRIVSNPDVLIENQKVIN